MNQFLITSVTGRQVWDSRGRPTVEAEVTLANGTKARAIAPAGASRGSAEAVDLRDRNSALAGWGVNKAVQNINQKIADLLIGLNAVDQQGIDYVMLEADGTTNKSRLGGNALISVSMAVLNAASSASGEPLWKYLTVGDDVVIPLPEIQIFGGGAHAGRRIDIQDIMAVPVGASTIDEALQMIAEVYLAAGDLMAASGRKFGVADEGGWWPEFDSNEQALDMLMRAIESAGYRPGLDISIALDVAASEFGAKGRYQFDLGQQTLDSDELIERLGDWIQRYPIISIEDPLAEDDANGFKKFTARYGDQILVVGDDFLVTNANRIAIAASSNLCNTALIKPNQAGTITETINAFLAAKKAGWRTIVSARSGETEDVSIAHLAVGWGAEQIKVGSFSRSERMAKWNELIRISESLGKHTRLAKF